MGRQTEVAALVVGGWIAAVAVSPAQGAHDTLNIGIAQFPSSLHPDIDPEVVRAYALGFAIRPITAFDADWKNTCLLCTELPTLENGLAKREDRPDGKRPQEREPIARRCARAQIAADGNGPPDDAGQVVPRHATGRRHLGQSAQPQL
jgi:hypothetical protein